MLATLRFDAPMPSGRPPKLTLMQRMDIRRRLRNTARGQRGALLSAFAKECGVSLSTVERTVYG